MDAWMDTGLGIFLVNLSVYQKKQAVGMNWNLCGVAPSPDLKQMHRNRRKPAVVKSGLD